MKKRKKLSDDIFGLINVANPKLIEEPKENPLDFPLTLTCGEDIWYRVTDGEDNGATYMWERKWLIMTAKDGQEQCYWASHIRLGPVNAETYKSFGEAVGLVRALKQMREDMKANKAKAVLEKQAIKHFHKFFKIADRKGWSLEKMAAMFKAALDNAYPPEEVLNK